MDILIYHGGNLFLWNYSPPKICANKKQLKSEIKAQVERFIDFFGDKQAIRFDSHQHTYDPYMLLGFA